MTLDTPDDERIALILHILEAGDDLQPDPAMPRLQLDLVIEDARVVCPDRPGSTECAVVQLADRVAHLEHLLTMIGRAARGEP